MRPYGTTVLINPTKTEEVEEEIDEENHKYRNRWLTETKGVRRSSEPGPRKYKGEPGLPDPWNRSVDVVTSPI